MRVRRIAKGSIVHHQYPNCPIREALVEFYFDAEAPWDDTYAGLFYQEVRAEYPVKEQRITNQASLESDGPQAGLKFELAKRFIAKRQDGTALLQLSPNLLVANVLAPYGGWEQLRAQAESALAAYSRTCAPTKLKSIGIRYLDRFELPSEETIKLEDYFNFYPHLPDDGPLAQAMTAFAVNADFPYAEGRDVLSLDLRIAPDQTPESIAVAFDSYYRSSMLDSLEPPVVMAWLEDAHERVSAAFEATLTDAMRSRLEGEK